MFVRSLAVIAAVGLAVPDQALAQAPAPVAAPDSSTPSPDPAAQPAPAPYAAQPPAYGPPPPGSVRPPPGWDPWLEAHLTNEWRYGEAIQRALGEDMRPEWDEFVEKERERARERASGDDDDDARPETFDRHLHKKYKGKRNRGITMVGVGFAPLLVGGLFTYSFDDARYMLFGLASIPLWAIGGVLWGRGQARLRHYESARGSLGLTSSQRPRLQFRGAGPLVNPHTGTGGVTLGFAF